MENSKITPEVEEINIKEILFRYLGYWKLFVVGAVLSLLVAYTYLRYASNIYQTNAKIKVLDPDTNLTKGYK